MATHAPHLGLALLFLGTWAGRAVGADGVLSASRVKAASGSVLSLDFSDRQRLFPAVRMRLEISGVVNFGKRKQIGWTDFGRVRPAEGRWERVRTEQNPVCSRTVYREAGGDGTFSIYLTRLTPALLIDTNVRKVTFFSGTQRTCDDVESLVHDQDHVYRKSKFSDVGGVPKYAAALQSGKTVVVETRQWKLPRSHTYATWFGESSYFYTFQPHAAAAVSLALSGSGKTYAKYVTRADAPFVFYMQNTPSAVEAVPGQGITFTFPGPAGCIASVPLLGFRTPAAKDTEAWGRERSLPEEIRKRAEWWARHLQEYPVRVTETYSCDPASRASRGLISGSVTVTERFEYVRVAKSPDPSARIAPLPPYLGIAVKFGFPLEFSADPVYSGTPTRIGPFMAVVGADSYRVTIRNLNRYGMQAERRRDSAPRSAYAARLLRREIGRVLDAGHLAPWLSFNGKGYNNYTYPDWSNPAATICALAPAVPLLDGELAGRVKAYLKQECGKYPPLATPMLPYSEGARREPYRTYLREIPKSVLKGNFYAFHRVFPVENLYAAALYHAALSDEDMLAEDRRRAEAILRAHNANQDWAVMKPLGRRMVWPDVLNGAGGVVDTNRFFAGLIGYIRLAEIAKDAQARDWGLYLLARTLVARYAEGKYTQFLYEADIQRPLDAPDWPMRLLRSSRKGRFSVLLTHRWSEAVDDIRQVYVLDQTGPTICEAPKASQAVILAVTDLVPELGLFLGDHLKPEIQKTVDRVTENSPHWYMAYKPARLGKEVFTDVPQVSLSCIQARAWALGESARELEKYLDVPWVPVGDYYYIQKLTACLTAKE